MNWTLLISMALGNPKGYRISQVWNISGSGNDMCFTMAKKQYS
jgi:hypothetical protein